MRKQSRTLLTTFFLLMVLPATAHANAGVYVVSVGDTLSKIARQHNTTVQQLMKINELQSDRLAIGQTLRISGQQPLLEQSVAEKPAILATPSPQTTTDAVSPVRAVVQADPLNVRSLPSMESEILGKLSFGTVLDVVEFGSEWTQIRYQNQEAFVASRYITPLSAVPAAEPAAADEQWVSKLQEIVQPLLKTRYVLGGSSPDGFDCSGFTSYVYQQLGVTLPRTSEEQFGVGQAVTLDQAMPGDLLFYDTLKKGRVSHVAMYLGNGLIVHANGEDVRYEKWEYMHKLYPFYGVKRYVPFSSAP